MFVGFVAFLSLGSDKWKRRLRGVRLASKTISDLVKFSRLSAFIITPISKINVSGIACIDMGINFSPVTAIIN